MINRRALMFATALVVAPCLAAAPAKAAYPEKPVEMTVLFGGTAQTIGQLLADLMSKDLGETVVPVSRTGGGGAVGYAHVQASAPDGYNIVWNSNSISTSYWKGNTPFNYEAFKPIARISTEVPALAVNADSGWKSVSDMVDAVKKGDQKLKVGISGNGSFTHLASAALFDKLGIGDKVIYVPYGEGKAPVELMGGRIDAAIQWPGQFIPQQEAGKLNILCVTSAERISVLPDTPTCAEAGADGVDITMWRGLAAPAGTPDEVVQKLQAAAEKAATSDEFKKAAGNIGFEPAYMPADQFGKLIAKDDQEIGSLMKDLGLSTK